MDQLFSWFKAGGFELANRFVFPPIKTALGTPSGEITDRHLNFYNRISEDGPGLIILEPVSASPAGREHPKQLQITPESSVKELQKIVDVIHRNDRKACLHLNHAGGAANPKVTGKNPVSASAYTCPSSAAEVLPLRINEIEEIIAAFGTAAKKAQEAGFDAVELQAGHGYLLSQFLNPALNGRDDEYGFDRTLLLHKVIEQVMDGAPQLAHILRVSGDEMAPAKSIPKEDIDNAIKLAEQSGFSAVHVGMGSSCFAPPWYFHHMSLPEKPQERALERIKSFTGMPVIAAGRMGSLERSERMLKMKYADMIALGRPLIADPRLIAKWEGKIEEPPQHCGYCLQGCLVHVKDGTGISCNVNPEVANPELEKSSHPLTVLIAGGGPAGVSAARALSDRGHHVTLAEKADEPGGVARLAPLAPGKESMARALNDFFSINHHSGLTVLLGREVDLKLVNKIKPDLLIWATGARSKMPFYPGMDKLHLITCVEAFNGEKQVKGNRVLIIGAGKNGLELAERLGRQGCQVVATKRTDTIGSYMEPISKKLCLARISKMPNVSLLPLTTVLQFTEEGVWIKREEQEQMLEKFDTAIMCAGMVPSDGPPREISEAVKDIEIIADARETADIFSAVKAGYEVALKY